MNEEDAELALDLAFSSATSDLRAAEHGVPLADFECEHGRLVNGEKCELCERRSMLDDLRPLAPEEPPKPAEQLDEVPCQYCGMPAPRRGPHAGRCPDHQGQPSKSRHAAARGKRKTAGRKKAARTPRPRAGASGMTPWQERYDAVTGKLAVKLAARGRLDVEIAELLRELNALMPDGVKFLAP